MYRRRHLLDPRPDTLPEGAHAGEGRGIRPGDGGENAAPSLEQLGAGGAGARALAAGDGMRPDHRPHAGPARLEGAHQAGFHAPDVGQDGAGAGVRAEAFGERRTGADGYGEHDRVGVGDRLGRILRGPIDEPAAVARPGPGRHRALRTAPASEPPTRPTPATVKRAKRGVSAYLAAAPRAPRRGRR